MTNPVYQKAVEELEALLSPRVVSRSLQQGLKQIGKGPDDVNLRDIENILKSQIYRQLQATLPSAQAKEVVKDIVEKLKAIEPQKLAKSEEFSLEQQNRALNELRAALRPFNLYFEWPETQKLRSQLKLLEAEQEAGHDAHKLLVSARKQLKELEQKLEDQLVTQARDLSELEAAFAQVKRLGGPKVRRLENLTGQIRSAQHNRQLAPAEVERARKIATDLRKLLESSVVVDDRRLQEMPSSTAVNIETDGLLEIDNAENSPFNIDTAELSPEISARLLLIDIESERRDLADLATEFNNLLNYKPELNAQFVQQRETLDRQTSLGEALGQLREHLVQAQGDLRRELQLELREIQRQLNAMDTRIDNDELSLALQVSLGILETTIPAYTDVQYLRDLYRFTREREVELATGSEQAAATETALKQQESEVQRSEQIAELHQLESELRPYQGLDSDNVVRLNELLAAARKLVDQELPVENLSQGWLLLNNIRDTVTRRAADFEPRLDAAKKAFEPISKLNNEDAAIVKRILGHLESQREVFYKVSPVVQSQLEASLTKAEGLIETLKEQFEATRSIANQLVSKNVLDDILGIFSTGPGETKQVLKSEPSAGETPPLYEQKSKSAEFNSWLEDYLAQDGLSGAAMFSSSGELVAGRLKLEPVKLNDTLEKLEHDNRNLSKELKLGDMRLMTVETPGHFITTIWPMPQYRLVFILGNPVIFGAVLQNLREDLPRLRGLLSGLKLA